VDQGPPGPSAASQPKADVRAGDQDKAVRIVFNRAHRHRDQGLRGCQLDRARTGWFSEADVEAGIAIGYAAQVSTEFCSHCLAQGTEVPLDDLPNPIEFDVDVAVSQSVAEPGDSPPTGSPGGGS
jgi:hypothetical protein